MKTASIILEGVCPACGLVQQWRLPASASTTQVLKSARCSGCGRDGIAQTGVFKEDQQKQKQSLYFPEAMLAEMQAEAKRLDRSLSWVVQRAFRRALPHITRLRGQEPAVPVGEQRGQAAE